MQARWTFRLSVLLALATLAIFMPAVRHDFLSHEDDRYVAANPHVRGGLSRDGLAWAATTFHADNWHPLTWLSHMLDCQLFGLDPRGHHLTSVLLHAVNAVVLFLLLRRLTGEQVRPALVAALFALHPLHVQPVAWVAVRKDLLSTFFGLLALTAYAAYARRPGPLRYGLIVVAFALSLAAKPMLVPLPLVMWLLDYWPLGRFATVSAWRRLAEKVPLFTMTAASCVVTIVARNAGAGAAPEDALPFGDRCANAAVAYAGYLRQAVWPADLAIHYPNPGASLPGWQVAAATALLLGLSVLAFRLRRRCPALLVGWLWFLVTLLPVIGLVQAAPEAMADRYTYVPLIGPFLALVWMVSVPGVRRGWVAVAGAAVAALAACAAVSWLSLGDYRDDRAVWQRALRVSPDDALAHHQWACVLSRDGDVAEAEEHFAEAMRLSPEFTPAYDGLANSLRRRGDVARALTLLSAAIEKDPGRPLLHNSRGLALAQLGHWAAAADSFREAVRLAANAAEYHYNLAAALRRCGRIAEAAAVYEEGRRLDPDWPQSAHEPVASKVR
jgi:tetratricopeptide (TPR) repeat protein